MPTQTHDLIGAWRAMRARLLAFVTSRADSHQDAEDIVQEVFIKISQGIGGLRDEQRLEAWIYQVTRNTIADHQHALSRTGHLHARVATERSLDSGTPERGALSTLTGCLVPLLGRLSERDRQAIALVEYDRLTQVEAARRLGVSVSGMKSRIQRARGRLRELLLSCCQIAMDTRGDVREVRAEGPCPCASQSNGSSS
ncbi:hypothetical protein GCM10022419_045810 [Nonomuraea rosea]|uniref:RNA polymerase sigma factor SigZ n=1 Tax=Nonomuraea rosea TaxID=638574 RepID=A0ABP6X3T7_9ACTN